MLPDKAQATFLEQLHPDYIKYRETWSIISDLREGAPALLKKAAFYCPQRPGETPDLYKLRLAKFSYTPVMSDSIREFTSKLSSAPISVEGLDDSGFWQGWLSAIDGKDLDQNEFLTQTFSSLLYMGKVLLAVDLPRVETSARSRLEDAPTRPYVIPFEPLAVTNWDGDAEKWFITKQVLQQGGPLEVPKTVTRWTVFTEEEVAVYEVETLLSKAGVAVRYVLPDGSRLAISDARASVPKVRSWVHGLGRVPAVSVKLPLEAWTGLNVYLKQLQHTRIEQSWTDAGTVAGTIQRIFTPTPPVSNDDPRYTMETPDYSDLKSSNAHILIGNGFQFVESSGSAIAALTSQLDTISAQIKSLVSMGWMSAQPQISQQSGVAKQVDMATLKDAMSAYGKRVAKAYAQVLLVVAQAAKISDNPTVAGLDSYEVDNLEAMVVLTKTLIDMLPLLPPSAWKIWINKLADLLTGTVSSAVKEQIKLEVEALDPLKAMQEQAEQAAEIQAKGSSQTKV